MGNVSLLDCTLRDGGYINDWNFGNDVIHFILNKLSQSGIEHIEVGFLKPGEKNNDRTVFPDMETVSDVIFPKKAGVIYVGMADMSNPLPIEKYGKRNEKTLDAIRVIFKQDRLEEGYNYSRKLKELGYLVMIQLVSTDTYTDKELADAVTKFSKLDPYAIYLVDSLGCIKKEQFLKMIRLMDDYMKNGIMLGYHAHNNLQQARGNAEAMVELELKRDIIIDTSVYGMGRGAGNLNEELFADYLNENYDKDYSISPMLEIVDECLQDIYQKHFWGYSMAYYLSASNRVHPNYAKYYLEKQTLTEKSFDELLKSIRSEDSHVFSKEIAEQYYIRYMENYIDDKESINRLTKELSEKSVLIIGPGDSIHAYKHEIECYIDEKKPVIISIGFIPSDVTPDYIFCSNLRKFERIKESGSRIMITSNIKEHSVADFVFNYSSYLSKENSVVDNSGLMLLKILQNVSIKEINIAGMDGYSTISKEPNVDYDIYKDYGSLMQTMNESMKKEMKRFMKKMNIGFVTPSFYNEES